MSELPRSPSPRRKALPVAVLAVTFVLAAALILVWGGDGGDVVVLGSVFAAAAVLWRQNRRGAVATRRRLSEVEASCRTAVEQTRPGVVAATVAGQVRELLEPELLSLGALPARQDAVDSSLAEIDRIVRQVHHETVSAPASTHRRRQVQQVQALLQLQQLGWVGPHLLGGWALSPDAMWSVLRVLDGRPAGTMVEVGGGVSTLYLAASQVSKQTPWRVISLEHDHDFAEQTRRRLSTAGLSHLAEVRDAPLTPVEVGGRRIPWYDVSVLDGIDQVDVLLVDGPPGAVHPLVRYPALPLLKDRLGPSCVVLLDDTVRRQEQDVVALWTQEMPDLKVLELDVEKGMTVLYRGDPPL